MPRGFGGGFGRGFGRGFGMRRMGIPLVMPMGGWGGGMGSPLLTTLMAGGLGYAMGSNAAQQNTPPYYQPYSQYPYQGAPPAPSAQGQAPVPNADSGRLAQLQLLGDLHAKGLLTDDEFEREKQRILSS